MFDGELGFDEDLCFFRSCVSQSLILPFIPLFIPSSFLSIR